MTSHRILVAVTHCSRYFVPGSDIEQHFAKALTLFEACSCNFQLEQQIFFLLFCIEVHACDQNLPLGVKCCPSPILYIAGKKILLEPGNVLGAY